MRKVAILGTTGLLGFGLCRYLSSKDFEVIELNRSGISVISTNYSKEFDAATITKNELTKLLEDVNWIVNCVGVIKHKINLDDDMSKELAVKVNVDFPKLLDLVAAENNKKVIQIGTDCVFSGKEFNYVESSPHDALDFYGKTKSAGELNLKSTLILRSSFVGRELNSNIEFLEWVLSHEDNNSINGYVNHLWNGCTVLHIAKIIEGIIINSKFIPGIRHLVPANFVTKYELAKLISETLGNSRVSISPAEDVTSINRTLDTNYRDFNEAVWKNAGYLAPPLIAEMIMEYAYWVKDDGNNYGN